MTRQPRTNSEPEKLPPPQTILVLVRHGRTPTTGKILPGRASGLHLSEDGIIEAKGAALKIAGSYEKVDAIYSSPLERTMETSSALAELIKQEVIEEPLLLECDFGEWTGKKLGELSKKREWKTVQQHPSRFRFPLGESFSEMAARMQAFLTIVSIRHAGKVVVAYSHADPIKAIITDCYGLHLDHIQRVHIAPASVSVIGLVGQTPSVLSVNVGDHLPKKVY